MNREGADFVSVSTRGGTASRPGIVPLAAGLAAVVVSVVLAVISVTAASETVTLLGIPVPVVRPASLWIAIVGYVLTPFAVIVIATWDRLTQWKGLQRNRDYEAKPVYTVVLHWLLIASFLVMIVHLAGLSVRLPEIWGLA